MKRVVAALLLAVLLGSLCACGAEQLPALPLQDPLVGTWEGKSEQVEATVTFKKKLGQLSGSWQFRDYENGKWQEFQFVVEKKTDFTMTLMVNDGTLMTVSYALFGNTLCLDGTDYTGSGKNAQISDAMKEKTLVAGDRIIPVWDKFYMGMTCEEVEAVLGESLQYWTDNTIYPGGRQGSLRPYVFIFDGNGQLANTQKTLVGDEQVAFGRDAYLKYTELFGDPEEHRREPEGYYEIVHIWRKDDFNIYLDQFYHTEDHSRAWTSVTIAK